MQWLGLGGAGRNWCRMKRTFLSWDCQCSKPEVMSRDSINILNVPEKKVGRSGVNSQ